MLQNLLSHVKIAIRRNTVPVSLNISPDASCGFQDAYPVEVKMARANGDEIRAPTSNVSPSPTRPRSHSF